MPIKLGTTNIILPYSKAYLGSDLVYQKSGGYVDTEFTECPFPTSWTAVTAYVKYSAENEYGIWNVEASSASGRSYPACNAFNGNLADLWHSTPIEDDNTAETIEISLPAKTFIKPTTIYVRNETQGNLHNKSKVQGYNSETNLWEDLITLDRRGDSPTASTYNVSSSTFYSKFRIECYKHSSTFSAVSIYELQVRSGMIRKYT